MSDEQFAIKSITGDNELVFSDPQAGGFSWDAEITIKGLGLHATRRADLYSVGTLSFVDFFKDLAESWKGWNGTKLFENLDNRFSIACSTDRLGHVFMRATLNPAAYIPFQDWTVETFIKLEVGQLEEIARQAGAFFESI